MINILNFRPLDYIIYMFITLNMHAFVLIECYLLFDPQTQVFVNIMVGSMVLKTGPVREPEKGVVPVSVVRPGSDRWSNR
jgi:hypothetical protein